MLTALISISFALAGLLAVAAIWRDGRAVLAQACQIHALLNFEEQAPVPVNRVVVALRPERRFRQDGMGAEPLMELAAAA